MVKGDSDVRLFFRLLGFLLSLVWKAFFFSKHVLTFLICTNLTDSNERFLDFGTSKTTITA